MSLPSQYLRIWQDGSLIREASTCRTVVEIAARFGVSDDALIGALARLRRAGHAIPSLSDMLGRGPRPVAAPATLGDWDDQTSPGMTPPVHEPAAEIDPEPGDTGPIHMERDVPAGHRVKGLSTFYNADGVVVAQWVKTAREEDDRLAALMRALETLAEPFRGLHEPLPLTEECNDDLLSIYAIGDPHIGMQAWGEECGEDFDVKIAERDLIGGVDHLVNISPPSGTAIVALLGDNAHVDGKSNATTAGTPQDVDTRWSKVFRILVRTARRAIERALTKHARVVGMIIPGNHDEHVALALAYAVQAYFERDERVTIDMSPAAFRWFRFGECFFGFNHGHNTKFEALPGIMACDRPKDWGETRYRKMLLGHVHHRQVKEMPGCVIQSYGTLAPKDAYHSSHGYRSMQEMRCEVYHRQWGPIAEFSAGISQIRSRAKDAA